MGKKRYRDMIKSVTTVKRKTKPNKGPSKKKSASAAAFDKLRVAHAKLVKKLNKQVNKKKAAKKSKGKKKKKKAAKKLNKKVNRKKAKKLHGAKKAEKKD